MVERHRDVGAERPLDVHRSFRREASAPPVDVRAKRDTIIIDRAFALEREYLKPSGVGKHRAWPCHEAMQASEFPHHRFARSHMQVIGVGEHDRRPNCLESER